MFRPRARIRRARDGSYELRLPADEREVLASLPGQLRQLLGTDDPSLHRLFPPAYLSHPELDREYRELMREDLLGSRAAALDVMEKTVQAERLEEAEVLAWLSALNDLRLVLGTRLDVDDDTELVVDPADPSAPAIALYGYLGWLQEQVIDALGDPTQ